MTYGTGTVGGGGGGFSGGGFSGGFTSGVIIGSTLHSGGRRRGGNHHSSQDCKECGNCCSFMFGCNKTMSRKQKYFVRSVWIAGIIIACLCLTLFVAFGDKNYDISPSDERLVGDKGGTTRFCSKITVDSYSSIASNMIDVYLLPNHPGIARSRNQFSDKKSEGLSYQKYVYYGYHLLSGSNINLNILMTSSQWPYSGAGRFFLIKGKNKLQKWLDDVYCSCYERKLSFYSSASNTTLRYTAIETDDYYLVFANIAFSSIHYITFHWYVTLDRTMYDTSNAMMHMESLPASFYLDYNSNEVVIVRVKNDFNLYTASIDVECESTAWLYVVIFLLVPVTLFSTFVVYQLWKHRKQRSAARESLLANSEAGYSHSNTTRPQNVVNTANAPPGSSAYATQYGGQYTNPPPYNYGQPGQGAPPYNQVTDLPPAYDSLNTK